MGVKLYVVENLHISRIATTLQSQNPFSQLTNSQTLNPTPQDPSTKLVQLATYPAPKRRKFPKNTLLTQCYTLWRALKVSGFLRTQPSR